MYPGDIYGLRACGHYEPDAGHRFNLNKLLSDPYAGGCFGELRWDPAVFGYTLDSSDADLRFDERDSEAFMPKCGRGSRLRLERSAADEGLPWDRTIIYEGHVKGFTKWHPAVPDRQKGTYGKEVVTFGLFGLSPAAVGLAGPAWSSEE